jgi:hypothetical protein
MGQYSIWKWEFGIRPIGAYACAPAEKGKIKAKIIAHRAEHKEKVKNGGLVAKKKRRKAKGSKG